MVNTQIIKGSKNIADYTKNRGADYIPETKSPSAAGC